MKKNKINKLIILTVLSITLSSCCTKMECLNAFDLNEIELDGFSIQETENILISSYVKGSNFNNFIDSSSTSARTRSGNDNEDLIIFSPIDINKNSDYLVEFKNNGQIYKITNIQTTFEKCNTCFLAKDDYELMYSYEINNLLQEIKYFKIIRDN